MCHSTSLFFFFKQKTAYELRISDWSSDVCSSDLRPQAPAATARPAARSRLHLFAAQVPQVVAEHAAGDHAHHQHLEHEAHAQLAAEQVVDRSETRRVGNGCVSTRGSRWSQDH